MVGTQNNDNKRIAKNTIYLYFRMIVTLLITLYTSRTILAILGENDFGIYNIVGGVVILFSFLTNAMTSSTLRFFNYHLGLQAKGRIETVFNVALIAHFTILIFVFVLAETIGLWFFETQINIPIDRIVSARWVYQMAIIASLINIVMIPYRAALIATEKISFFATLSIVEVVLKLLIVIILPFFFCDSLILYSILLTLVTFFVFIVYWYISKREIYFSKFNFEYDFQLYKEMMLFSGYHLFGGLAMVGSKQGLNILLNIFYNVAINAAVGVANQVRSAVYGFVASFQTAFNPQIVKLYASNDYDKLYSLIYRTSKFSYYLLLILSLPVITYTEELLTLWLVDVPAYTIDFTQLVIISSFFEALTAPLGISIGATGKVKNYQLFVSLIMLCDIPVAYIALKYFNNPILVFVVDILICFIAYLFRLLYVRKYVGYSLKIYIKSVLIPCLSVTLLLMPFTFVFSMYGNQLTHIIFFSILICIVTLLVLYIVGLDKKEKAFALKIVKIY